MFGDLSPAEFLRDHWQTAPLVAKEALPEFCSPLSPEELAGLACEPHVESRLLLEEGGAHPWELRHGPFDADAFGALPESHWTLLVQEVDRLVPEVAQLLDRFDFLPRWRIDDIMVSYAPTGGTVGPHIDNYDVFLIQGAGHRRWEIGHAPVDDESIVPDRDVRMLANFSPDATHVLGPGDLLYLPPRVAHHGVAVDDDCMTYSVGFRAPSHRDLLADFLQHAMEQVDPEARFADPNRAPVANAGALPEADRQTARMLLRTLVADDDALDRWFAQFVTQPSRDRLAVPPDEPWTPDALAEAVREGAELWHGTASRLVFYPADAPEVLVANGVAHALTDDTRALAPLLCNNDRCTGADVAPHLSAPAARALLATLVNDGVLDVLPASA